MTPLLSTPLLRAQSDRRLTALAGNGHDRAFEEIVERYRRPLQRYLRRLLAEPLAEDVLQATFVRAWQSLSAGTDVRELRPWLYRIAHNQALNALRAAGSALQEVPGLAVTSTEAEFERREELRATLHGIGALPDRQRAALVAVAVADRPHADVAAELGLSDGALRQLLLRARTALRAAATAITPYPLVTWMASGQEVSAARVAEVAAGAGGAGLAVKAGAAILAAGAVVAGAPALRDEHAAPAAKPRPALRAKPSAPSLEPAAAITRASAPPPATVTSKRSRHRRSGSRDADRTRGPSASSGPGPSRSGEVSHRGSDDSGKDSRGDHDTTTTHDHEGSDDSGSGDSGSGGSSSADSGSGGTGSGESESGDLSGSGSGEDGTTTLSTTPTTTSGDTSSGGSSGGTSTDGHSGDGGGTGSD
jgi:RNA polymerase sigma factor (sigma-70 family)